MGRTCLPDAGFKDPRATDVQPAQLLQRLPQSLLERLQHWCCKTWESTVADRTAGQSLIYKAAKHSKVQRMDTAKENAGRERYELKTQSASPHPLLPNLWEGLLRLYWPYQPLMNTSLRYLNHLLSWSHSTTSDEQQNSFMVTLDYQLVKNKTVSWSHYTTSDEQQNSFMITLD